MTGFVRDNTTLIKGGKGTSYNHRAGSFRAFPSPPSIPQQFAPHYRRLPHLLLRQALDRRDTVRSLGPATNVDRIAGVHGRSATIEELRARLKE